MIEYIFPVPLFSEKLNLNVKDMTKYCLDFKKKASSVSVSNIGGWQSPSLEGEHKPLNDLFKSILDASEKYCEIIQYKHPLKIGALWVNINRYKDYNTDHIHPHSVASGVFYVKAKSGDLIFKHPLSKVMEYDWPLSTLESYNRSNCPNWEIPPVNNQLLIFPGWLTHLVRPNLNKEDRISISFNLIR